MQIPVSCKLVHCMLRCRSKVGAAFDDKHGARQVRPGKYRLVDLASSFPPATSSGASKPAAKYVTCALHAGKCLAPSFDSSVSQKRYFWSWRLLRSNLANAYVHMRLREQ